MARWAPALVTIDVGGTLGVADGPTLTSVLVARSPLDPAEALRMLRGCLHTAPAISDELIEQVCRLLRIPTSAFPGSVTPAPLRLLPGVPAALTAIADHVPLVTLSNVTCVDDDSGRQGELLAPWVGAHFPSYKIGYAKPDHRAFGTVATRCGVSTNQIVHIGDHWECDILGAVGAGARAVWLSGGRAGPDGQRFAASRVLMARDLASAAEHIRDLCTRRRW